MSHATGPAIEVLAPRSKFYEGAFGRLCPDLPGWSPDGVADADVPDVLTAFANTHMVEEPGVEPGALTGPAEVDALETKFGSAIPAGYTYFGQFIDHDLTLDLTSLGTRQVDPNGLKNFRTPRLDLDCVYGAGPGDQPFLYTAPNNRMVTGKVAGTELNDLLRNPDGRAIIGDMRNDENSMVSQMQLAFVMAHNTLVGRAENLGMPDPFEAARKTLRWLYQWVIWNDFLPRVTVDAVQQAALSLTDTPDGRKVWKLGLQDVYNWKHQPFMPVEFAAAAYRFGHSMVRNAYRTNFEHNQLRFIPIFNNVSFTDENLVDATRDLRGFRAMTAQNSIQWDWFLQMTSSSGPFPQKARKIDTALSNALLFLPEDDDPDALANKLAARNLIRGWRMALPSGPDMADKWCIDKVTLTEEEPEALWYYVLREAQAQGGERLGRLGSVILCATFGGILKGDPMSFVNMDPCWTPGTDPLLCDGVDNIDDPDWGLPAIIRISGLPVDGGDVTAQTNGDASVATAQEAREACVVATSSGA